MTTSMRRIWTRALLIALVATQLVAATLIGQADAAAAFSYRAVASDASSGTSAPSVSADGRYVVFETTARLLPDHDPESGTRDVYLYDRQTDQYRILSGDLPGELGESILAGSSYGATISGDGRYAVFTNDRWDMFADAPAGGSQVIRVSLDGPLDWRWVGGGSSYEAVANDISHDGSVVVWSTDQPVDEFQSFGTVSSDDNDVSDVIHTRIDDEGGLDHEVVSLDGDANDTDIGASYDASVSPDGSFVAYVNDEHESLTPDDNEGPDILVSWAGGNTSFQITGTYTVDGPGTSEYRNWAPIALGTEASPQVLFLSDQPFHEENEDGEVVEGVDPEGVIHAYRWTMTDGHTYEPLTISSDGIALGSDVLDLAASPNGRFVVFTTSATNVVDDVATTGSGPHVYRLDLEEPQDERQPVLINQLANGTASPGEHVGIAVANDGTVAFGAPDGLDPADTNGHRDVLVTGAPSVEPDDASITSFTLSSSAGDGEVPVGLDTVGIDDIPVGSIPLQNASLPATPIKSIDVAASPIKSIPIKSIPIKSIAALDGLSLSAIPVDGGWAPRLEGTIYEGRPLHTVTLGQVAELVPDAAGRHPLDGVTLGSLDIAASPIKSISIAALALGSTPIKSIPIKSIGPGCLFPEDAPVVTGEAAWQAIVDCLLADFTVGPDTTLAALDIAGVPIKSIPIKSIPIKSIDLAASPIKSIPIKSIDLAATPIKSIPIKSIVMSTPIKSIPIKSIPIKSIDVVSSPIKSIPIKSIPIKSIFNCDKVDCGPDSTMTLGEAADLGGILEHATLQDIVDALDGFSLGDLLFYGDVTLGDLLAVQYPAGQDPWASITLGDLVLGLLRASDYPWEELPVADMGLQPIAPTDELVSVTAAATVAGDATAAPSTLTVELPAGATYAPGTGEYQRVSGGAMTHVPPFFPVEPSVSGRQLTFTLPTNGAGSITTVRFDYHPGVRLQAAELSGSYDIGTDSATASAVTYDLVQRSRPADPAQAPVLSDGNTLVVGHLAVPGEVDYFRIPAAAVAGKRVRIDLAVPGSDQDLVLYAPTQSVPATATTLEAVPPRSVAVEDGATEVVPPETLQDIPIKSIPIKSISANRGDADEAVEVLADETETGFYTIQVSGYNDAASVDPYVLRMRVTDPPTGPECTPRVHEHASSAQAPTSTSLDDAPEGTDALFVVNPSRLDAIYGAGEGQAVVDAISDLLEDDDGANALGMEGHILEVDRSADVRAAYAAWDEDPCSPAAANGVVTAITALIEASHLAATGTTTADVEETIPYVVLVGGDDTLPQARVPDLTRIANERTYLSEIAGDHPLAGAAHAETLLSDDPYGDRDPMPWLNRYLYVPDTALGRLVETPDQIIEQLGRYATWEGSLEPTTAAGGVREMKGFVTGYDFLDDGAEAVAAALDDNDIVTGAAGRMISAVWSRSDLAAALFGTVGTAGHVAADVIAINAHFDHHRSLPANEDAAGTEDDLFTTEDVDAAADESLARRILFSMGCHSGMSVPDVYVEGTRDWAETFADGGAVYAANTGYGYGDTAAVALSERLMAGFADNLDGTMSVGQAMQFAKQHYASQLGLYGAYDEKVMAEATFYGLPMFRVRGTSASSPVPTPDLPAPAALPTVGGVLASPFQVQEGAGADYELRSEEVDGTHFNEVAGELPQVTHGRPITPRFDLDATAAGKQARGVLLTGLVSKDGPVVDATFARPVIADSEREPAQAADVAFPAYFASVNNHRTPAGAAAKLVLMPGQFVPDGTANTVGRGHQRTFTEMSGFVTYVDPGSPEAEDVTPPSILTTSAESNATTAAFQATIVESETDVERVIVLYRDPERSDGKWLSVPMVPGGGGQVWEASVPSGGADQIEYLVQAVDSAGNVGATTNKGVMHSASTDAEPPAVTVTSPASGGIYEVGSQLIVDFACQDDNLELCGAELDGMSVANGHQVDTAGPGSHSLVVTAEDRFGNVTKQTISFRIGFAEFTFSEPVSAGQRTQVKAGSAVPVRFRIEDADGPVSDRNAITSITSTKLTGCDGSTVPGEELPATNELSGLHYDSTTGEWKYVWKTEKSWKNHCRLLTVTLSDGQKFSAQFSFR